MLYAMWYPQHSIQPLPLLLVFALEIAAKFPEAGVMATLSLISVTGISPLKAVKVSIPPISVCYTEIKMYILFFVSFSFSNDIKCTYDRLC